MPYFFCNEMQRIDFDMITIVVNIRDQVHFFNDLLLINKNL